jgi:hypothetical protein
MRRLFLMGVAASALWGATPASSATVTVVNVGSILNESLPLPAESTPGLGIAFAQYFEFELPVAEEVTASVSDSGIGAEKIVGGLLSLNNWTTTGPGPLFIPGGLLIDSTGFTNTIGGQTATVGPDDLSAGNYFVEISGKSGASAIKLAIDGTVTAVAIVPEASTWVMAGIGFAFLAFASSRKRRDSLSLI